MLRGVIRSTLIAADQAAERRAVHDGAATLFAHNLKLELHAAPDTAQIDAHHTVIVSAWGVGGFCKNILDASVVIGGIQSAELSHDLLHHSFDLLIVRHVTGNGQRLVTFVSELLPCSPHLLLAPFSEYPRYPTFTKTFSFSSTSPACP